MSLLSLKTLVYYIQASVLCQLSLPQINLRLFEKITLLIFAKKAPKGRTRKRHEAIGLTSDESCLCSCLWPWFTITSLVSKEEVSSFGLKRLPIGLY